MIPASFAYARPKSVREAVELLSAQPGEAKVIAGGQSLLPLLKLRVASVERLIDIGRLAELRGVRLTDDGGLEIGALTTYRELHESVAAARYHVIAAAIPEIADVQVRNRGTVGGALAHADPASDLPAVMLVLDAIVVARSASGERRIPVADGFFRGPFETALEPDELLTSIILPAPPKDAGTAYRTIQQPASGYSLVGVAAALAHHPAVLGSTTLGHVRVAVTGVSDHAFRARSVEAALEGTDGSPAAIAAAVVTITDGVSISSDIHADADYRAAMARVVAQRALAAAKQHAG